MISIIIPVYNNEGTIRQTIESIRMQSYEDFEVILINDGSTDGSSGIIRDAVGSDPRFVYIEQENQGVSAARNRGLEVATGKYVTFTDGDDLLPPDALKWMHQVAAANDADTIAGIFTKVDGTFARNNSRSENIVRKGPWIQPDDPDLINTWTLCNKWLSRSIIEEHNIRFENLKHVEDGVFLYSYLQYVERIYTCPHEVYTYVKPLPYIGRTSTQNIDPALLEDANRSFSRLSELTVTYGEEFHRELIRRYIHTPWIGDYYRRLWKLDADTTDELHGIITAKLRELDEGRRNDFTADHFDLFREGSLITREEFLEAPLVAVVLTGRITEAHVSDILDGIYDQYEPSFVVVADSKFRHLTADRYDHADNLIWADTCDIYNAAGKTSAKYIVVLDRDMLFNHTTLFRMLREMERSADAEAAVMQYDNYIDGHVVKSSLSSYIQTSDAADLDYILSNKLIRNIPEVIELFNHDADGIRILKGRKYIRLNRPKMLSLETDEDILKDTGRKAPVYAYRLHSAAGRLGLHRIKSGVKRAFRAVRKNN